MLVNSHNDKQIVPSFYDVKKWNIKTIRLLVDVNGVIQTKWRISLNAKQSWTYETHLTIENFVAN